VEPISFSVENNLEDFKALQQAARLRVFRTASRLERLQWRLFGVVLIVIMVAGVTWIHGDDAQLAWVVGIALTMALIAGQSRMMLRQYRPLADGTFFDPARFTLDSSGIRNIRTRGEGFVQWRQVLAIDITATHVFAWLDSSSGYVWPARSLPAPLTTGELAERIRGFMAAAGTAAPVSPIYEGAPTPSPTLGSPAAIPVEQPSVLRELAAVGRLLINRRVDGAALFGGDLTILVATLILLALWIPLDPLVYPEALEFNWWGLPSLAWVFLGVLGLAWVLSRLSQPQIPYRRTLLLALGAMPIAIAASTVNALVEEKWFVILLTVMMIWALVYLRRGLIAVSGALQLRAMVVAIAATFGFVLASDQLYVDPSFWTYAEDQDSSDEWSPEGDAQTWARMEEAQFEQQARLDEELSRIAALPRAKNAAYFIGFAGYGEQRVFAEEIGLARKQIAARYGTAQRSVSLVNDQRDSDKLPLASAPALRYTLEGIGSMMGPDDVLFLALSSHGSQGGTISISNVGRQPADLGAVELASMLRDAKIPWKVIVISACYAGGFIDALRDDHTIVLAAAAADRTSFGCSDDRDLTYFGEAFYRDALPKAANLRAAFELARAEIARREKEEKVEPSDPQAFYGELLEAKLQAVSGGENREKLVAPPSAHQPEFSPFSPPDTTSYGSSVAPIR